MKQYQSPEIKGKLDFLKEIILNVVPDTEAIYIFGSYVNGKPNEHSDLDIFVVIPDNGISEFDAYIEIRQKIVDKTTIFIPLDLLIDYSTNFKKKLKPRTFINTIATTGVKIYG